MSKDSGSVRRLVSFVLIAVVVVTAGLWGLLWFQDAPLRTAEALLEGGNAAEALRAIEQWESEHGARGMSQALRARSLVELGRYSEAISLFERVGAEETEELHAWARAWLHLRQWAHALPILEEVQRQDPDNLDVLHELASCNAKLGQLDEALKHARQFVKHEHFAHRGWLLIGMLLKDQGNATEAADAWSRIEAHDPGFDDLQVPAQEFLTQFAALQLSLGHPERAVELLQSGLNREETAEGHYQFGLALQQLRDPNSAVQHWSRALTLDPDHRPSREALARQAIAAGDPERAMKLLEPIIQHDPVSSTTYLMQRAAYLQGDEASAGQWRKKTERLRKQETIDSTVSQLLRESPDSYWAQVVRCYQFAERGNWQQAEVLLERLRTTGKEHAFVVRLREAVNQRGPLPSTELLPITLF